MKANSPKRKVFQDALDLLTEDMAVDKAVSEKWYSADCYW